jgi:hypothetical protein
MNNKARVIAFYLPQFHPIKENDEWWGKGFTEWTNVGKAKPLFKGHYQPRVPKDLGYYDLRIPEVREAQAQMAKIHGIEGFCYWHYWFGNGKRLLERPFNEVLETGNPNFPFCLAWANESWKGFNHGLKNRNVLIEQLYPGVEDYEAHFYEILPAFKDKRYILIDEMPVFVIYKPLANSEVVTFMKSWRELSIINGLKGIFFVGISDELNPINKVFETGVNAINTIRLNDYLINKRSFQRKLFDYLNKKSHLFPTIISYRKASKYFTFESIDQQEKIFPSIIPGWDHTPRSGYDGIVVTKSTPKLFQKHVKKVIQLVQNKQPDHRVVFLKSWNEWAEGNYVEPDLKFGLQFLHVLKKEIQE